MKSIEEIQALINQHIACTSYPKAPAELYEPIRYIMNVGGKRMRSTLVLIGCDLFNGPIHQALKAAIAIELFHNFTLIHDDIMDQAPIRRGKATVHAKWNTSTAILVGDVLLVTAYQLFLEVQSKQLSQILKIFNDTAIGVCEGQQMDMNFEQKDDIVLQDYWHMVRMKTGILFGAALKIGALLAGATELPASLLCDAGTNMGIAFQLRDDILDVYGATEQCGKPIGGDITFNKKTFLLIKAKELATEDDKKKLNYWLNVPDKEAHSPKKVEALSAIYDRLAIKQLAEKEIHNYSSQALKSLDKIGLPPERSTQLRKLLDQSLLEFC